MSATASGSLYTVENARSPLYLKLRVLGAAAAAAAPAAAAAAWRSLRFM